MHTYAANNSITTSTSIQHQYQQPMTPRGPIDATQQRWLDVVDPTTTVPAYL